MTPTVKRATTPPGAVLVRVPADGPGWARSLPPVPSGTSVTVTVSDPALARVPADDLIGTGYRIAGVVETSVGPATSAVTLLVGPTLRTLEPTWFRALLGMADRTLHCDLGPVQRAFASTIQLHLGAASDR